MFQTSFLLENACILLIAVEYFKSFVFFCNKRWFFCFFFVFFFYFLLFRLGRRRQFFRCIFVGFPRSHFQDGIQRRKPSSLAGRATTFDPEPKYAGIFVCTGAVEFLIVTSTSIFFCFFLLRCRPVANAAAMAKLPLLPFFPSL